MTKLFDHPANFLPESVLLHFPIRYNIRNRNLEFTLTFLFEIGSLSSNRRTI